MDLDVDLNFDTAPSTSVHIAKNTSKSQKWKDRLKDRRLQKREAKRRAPGLESQPKRAKTDSEAPQDTTGPKPNPNQGPHYKPPSEKARDGSKQVVSSLFSSVEMPDVTEAEPIEPKAPSNTTLSLELRNLGLVEQLVAHAVTKLGISNPTSVQASAIPWLLEDDHRDTMIYAQTGSGKTLAFVLPVIQDLLTLDRRLVASFDGPMRNLGTMAIILAPTRELASQIYSVVVSVLSMASSHDFTMSPRALTPCLLVGGANRTHEKSRLRKGSPIVVATPGRLLDHLQQTKSFKLAGEDVASGAALRWLVMDECDRLMDMGFEEQVRGILENLHARLSRYSSRPYRTVLASATAGDKVDALVKIAAGSQPKVISALSESEGAGSLSLPEQLVHKYVICPAKLRFVSLLALLRKLVRDARTAENPGKILVFMSSTGAVDFYWKAMGGLDMSKSGEHDDDHEDSEDVQAQGPKDPIRQTCSLLGDLPVYRLHGNLDMQTRLTSIRHFSLSSRLSKATSRRLAAAGTDASTAPPSDESVMITTSVAARGLDIPNVSHVVIFDLPTEGGVAEYVHRVGRTARAGAPGDAYTFLLPSEKDWVEWAEEGVRSFGKEEAPPEPEAENGDHVTEGEQDEPPATSAEDENKNKHTIRANPSTNGHGHHEDSTSSFTLHQVGVESILKDGFGGGDEFEARATDVQMAFERWVASDKAHQMEARSAFKDYVRAYATHPRIEKFIFNKNALHLGHLAKSFGMREAPGSGRMRDGSVVQAPRATTEKPRKPRVPSFGEPKQGENTGLATKGDLLAVQGKPSPGNDLSLAQSVLANPAKAKRSRDSDLDLRPKPSAQDKMKKMMMKLGQNSSSEYQIADAGLLKSLRSEK